MRRERRPLVGLREASEGYTAFRVKRTLLLPQKLPVSERGFEIEPGVELLSNGSVRVNNRFVGWTTREAIRRRTQQYVGIISCGISRG